MRATAEEIKELMSDIEWWRVRRPDGWGMLSMDGRRAAVFVSPAGREVEVDGELMTTLMQPGYVAVPKPMSVEHVGTTRGAGGESFALGLWYRKDDFDAAKAALATPTPAEGE